MNLGDRLKKLRLEKNLRQQDVADDLGIHRATFGNYESGQRTPSIDQIIKIANYFNVSLDFLLKGEYVENHYNIEGHIVKLIPVISGFEQGLNALLENIECLKPAVLPLDAPDMFFYIRIIDMSMCNDKLSLGDLVLFKREEEFIEDVLSLYLIDGRKMILGRTQVQDNIIILFPANSSFKALGFTKEDINNKRLDILGVALNGYIKLDEKTKLNTIWDLDNFVSEDGLDNRFGSIFED